MSRGTLLRAALLACGEGAVVSHGTAAAFHGLWDYWPHFIDVTVPVEAGRKIDGIRCRRCRHPEPEEVESQKGVTVTTVARTLVDLAGILELDALRKAVGRAAIRKKLRPDVRSDFETLVLPELIELGSLRPQVNAPLDIDGERFLVDFLWEQSLNRQGDPDGVPGTHLFNRT